MKKTKLAFIIIVVITGISVIISAFNNSVVNVRDKYITKDFIFIPGKGKINSFYISAYEEYNLNYITYLEWVRRVFGTDFPEIYKAAIPDTNVWAKQFSYNDPFVSNYLWHPAYYYYPVVGVSWQQACDYCAWKTDRLNETILIHAGFLGFEPFQINEDNFNTEAYLAQQYYGLTNEEKIEKTFGVERMLAWKDKYLLPAFRLPTEYEWELAYQYLSVQQEAKPIDLGIVIKMDNFYLNRWTPFNVVDNQMCTFDDKSFLKRTPRKLEISTQSRGKDVALSAPKFFGMDDNVSEWVLDIYNPEKNISSESLLDIYKSLGQQEVSISDDDATEETKNFMGKMNYIIIGENDKGESIKVNVNYLFDLNEDNSIIVKKPSDKEKIYRGGSWLDKKYVANKRGFLRGDSCAVDVGFRCVMSKVN